MKKKSKNKIMGSNERKVKLVSIKTSNKLCGGNILRDKVDKFLSLMFPLRVITVDSGHGNIIIKKIKLFFNLLRLKQNNKFEIFILDYWSTITLFRKPKSYNILNIFHIDNSIRPFRFFHYFLEKLFYMNLRNIDTIVVMSKYWKDHFEAKGYKDVRLIYCGFDMKNFEISDKEVEDFKKKYNILGKPIIYLGNCQKAKGILEAYESLKDLDVYFVSSGKRSVSVPTLNLNLNYKEYLTLLKSVDVVVTMSKFKEGWCMVAHEAMLVKTPVIGSGKGGMGELLSKGGQIICNDFKDLKKFVVDLLENEEKKKRMVDKGQRYARKFTNKKLKNSWSELLNEVENKINNNQN
jgi:glycosyltransferase involved in cell wall biosynthesis